MSLHRISSITIRVPDPVASGRFFEAFGLGALGGGRYATRDGGEQVRVEAAVPRGLRRLAVAVDDPDDLDRIATALRGAGHDVRRWNDPDGVTHSHHAGAMDRGTGVGSSVGGESDVVEVVEPVTGVTVAVEVAPRLSPSAVVPAALNAPGAVHRYDRPAASVLEDSPVRPSNLTHLVLTSPDQPATLAFFTDLLGFEISDALPGVIAFTRCGEVHHNLALQQAPMAMLHHVAFEVDSVDDVARGGSRLIEADAEAHVWGLGRHAIGSNWFWYLREPGGNYMEYSADIDRISSQELYRAKQWAPREHFYAMGPPPPPVFLDPADAAEILAAQSQ